MGDHMLNLLVKTNTPLALQIGDYVMFNDEKYKLKTLAQPKRVDTWHYEYTLTLYAPKYDLQDALYVLEDYTGVGKLDDSIPLAGTLLFHLQQIVKCVQVVHPEWSVGDVTETDEVKSITYDEMDCLQALEQLCETFGVEYWVNAGTTAINLGVHKSGDPITLSYGQTNALYDLTRQNQDGQIVTKLLVRGSDRNIDASTYGDKYLHLPDGTRYVTRNTDKYGVLMGRQNFEDIYPRLIHNVDTDPGSITAVRVDDNGVYWLKDANLDFEPELIAGQTLKVVFQTGELAGLSIDANWHDDTKEYELITGDYGLSMDIPSSPFVPAVGDLYLLSDLKMPQAYIDAAEQELLTAATAAIAQISEQKVSYVCSQLNPLWLRHQGRLEVGRAVTVYDSVLVDGGSVELRIQSITRNVNDDLQTKIEVSDTLYSSRIDKIEQAQQETKTDTNQRLNANRSAERRTYKQMREALDLLSAAIDGFGDSINPIYIQTMALLAGSSELQFRFVTNTSYPDSTVVVPVFSYNKTTKVFSVTPDAFLQHMTLGITTLSTAHTPADYMKWRTPAQTFNPLTDGSKAYYLYVKGGKTPISANHHYAGTYILSETAIKPWDNSDGYYYFLVGTLSSEDNGDRAFNPLYGYSALLPGLLVVDKITDSGGNLVIDLVAGTITGYNQITDRPDLTGFATSAQLQVLSDSVTSTVTAINTNLSQLGSDVDSLGDTVGSMTGTIATMQSSITQNAQDITLKVSQTDFNGNTIIGKINLTSTTATIAASRVNLIGQVTFSMFASDAQTIINGAQSSADNAYANAIAAQTAASDAQSAANSAQTTANSASTGLATLESSLGAMAYQNTVELAKLGTTIIQGGYIKSSLIDVDTIIANAAYIGNFSIVGGWLSANANAPSYIQMLGTNTNITFGQNVFPGTYPGNSTARIENANPIAPPQPTALPLYGVNVAVRLKATGYKATHIVNGSIVDYGSSGSCIVPLAIQAYGGVTIVGSVSICEEIINISDWGWDLQYLQYYRRFVWQGTANQSITLPSQAMMSSLFGTFGNGWGTGYAGAVELTFLVTAYATATLTLYGIVSDSGSTGSSVALSKGDVCKVIYFNANWYLVNKTNY
jgi:hypothetical protein